MNNTIQLYSDSKKNNKVYPITSPDRVILEYISILDYGVSAINN